MVGLGTVLSPGTRVRVIGLFGCIALLAFLAGCGSSGSSSSSSEASTAETSEEGGGGSAGIEQGEEILAKVSKSDQTIGVTTPLKVRPEGKTFVFLPCGAESCEKWEPEGFEASAKILGAKTDIVPQGPTPPSITSAWNQISTRTPPYDGVWYGGTPPSTVSSQISALQKDDVPVVGFNSNLENKPGGGTNYPGVDFDIAPNGWGEEIGKIQAAWITVDSEAEANVLYVNIKAYPGLVLTEKTTQEELGKMCPECKFSSLPVEPTDLGTKVPEKVVAALQRDPSINYVVFGFGEIALGVPPALKSAGLNEQVKIVSETGSPQTIEYIKNGEQAMDVSVNLEEAGWKAMDVLARLSTGEGSEASEAYLPLVVTTTESLENGDVKISPTETVLTAPNFEKEYTELWSK